MHILEDYEMHNNTLAMYVIISTYQHFRCHHQVDSMSHSATKYFPVSIVKLLYGCIAPSKSDIV